MREVYVSDFYFFIPTENDVIFKPRDGYSYILTPQNANCKIEGEYMAKKEIWAKKEKLKLKIEYRFLIKGDFIQSEQFIY